MKALRRPFVPVAEALVRAGPARATALMTALLAVLLLAVFAAEALWIRSAVTSTALYQREIRVAEVMRSVVLRMQLDEETGMRGYSATNDKVFLEPYLQACRTLPTALARLNRSLKLLKANPAIVNAAARQSSVNATWLRTVAIPLIANPKRANAYVLQLRGKTLLDGFRRDSDFLQRALSNTADAVDRSSERIIARVILWSLGLGIVLIVVLALYAYVQGRLVEELQVQRQAYENEKQIADALQEAFIQKALPTFPNVVFDAVYVPASKEAQVGGDWYDAFELPDKRILFSIGDVAGHGIDAAVVMSRARQAILSLGLQEHDPAVVFARANRVLMLQGLTMVTAVCGYIDPRSMQIVYATAGHPPPILTSPDGAIDSLPYFGPPLGIVAGAEYRSFTRPVLDSALLVFYTDGVLEYSRNILKGEEVLHQAIAAVARERPPNPAQCLLDRIFAGGIAPNDDVAILVASFGRPSPDRLRETLLRKDGRQDQTPLSASDRLAFVSSYPLSSILRMSEADVRR